LPSEQHQVYSRQGCAVQLDAAEGLLPDIKTVHLHQQANTGRQSPSSQSTSCPDAPHSVHTSIKASQTAAKATGARTTYIRAGHDASSAWLSPLKFHSPKEQPPTNTQPMCDGTKDLPHAHMEQRCYRVHRSRTRPWKSLHTAAHPFCSHAAPQLVAPPRRLPLHRQGVRVGGGHRAQTRPPPLTHTHTTPIHTGQHCYRMYRSRKRLWRLLHTAAHPFCSRTAPTTGSTTQQLPTHCNTQHSQPQHDNRLS
jgi:hypothetical protein